MDLISQQIARLNEIGKNHPWGIICVRMGYEPSRDPLGAPLSSGPRKPMDRFALQLDGATYLDGEITPSDPPRRWLTTVRVIWNKFYQHPHWDEDSVFGNLAPGHYVNLEDLVPLVEKYNAKALERIKS